MNPEDRPAFAVLLYGLGEVYNESVSEDRAELYFIALEDLTLEQVRVAAKQFLKGKGHQFFPKPADLIEAALGNVDDQAETAWQHVLREIRRVGWVGTPSWPDAATERAALGLFGGGWRTLCEHLPAQGPELLGYRKQFIAGYGAAARAAQQGLLPPSQREAAKALSDLQRALAARGLPTGEL